MDALFKIFHLDKQGAIKIGESSNYPHQHEYEELIIGLKGRLTHFIDYKTETIDAPFISYITKGKIHRFEPQLLDDDCLLWVLRFKSELIPETTFQLYNYYHDQANFELKTERDIRRLHSLCEIIAEEAMQKKPELAIIRELLSVILTTIGIERQNQHNNSFTTNQNMTFRNFLTILEANFRRSESVNFYAEKLFMSARNLNIITQNILHQSVSEIIETRKLTEAKNLLFTTDKSVAEIGFEIGYTDKAYFTSVFKKKTGMTPTEFREEMNGLLS